MKLLDLFCGVGGCAVGYARAGFEVTGVDDYRQLDYPYEFIRADAIEYVLAYGHLYDVIHASPPCQAYTRLGALHDARHLDLMQLTRAALIMIGKPWVIENVPEAPMSGIILCGQMFGLRVIRHRRFESSVLLTPPPHPAHPKTRTRYKGQYEWDGRDGMVSVYGNSFSIDAGRDALGIFHTRSRRGLANAIPPAYTEYIGRQLQECLCSPSLS